MTDNKQKAYKKYIKYGRRSCQEAKYSKTAVQTRQRGRALSRAGAGKPRPPGQTQPLPVFVNTVFLARSHVCSLSVVWGCCCVTMAGLSGCNGHPTSSAKPHPLRKVCQPPLYGMFREGCSEELKGKVMSERCRRDLSWKVPQATCLLSLLRPECT